MGIYVKNGTPVNGPSMCESCSRGFIARGYSETELVVVCQALWPERRIHFPVRACTGTPRRIGRRLEKWKKSPWFWTGLH